MREAAAPERQLKRSLTALDLTALGIGAIIGTGIFGTYRHRRGRRTNSRLRLENTASQFSAGFDDS